MTVVVVVRKTKIRLCRHLNRTPMAVTAVMGRPQIPPINIQVRNKDNTVIHSTDRVINISIKIGSIHKADTVVIINGVVMAAVIAINYFHFCSVCSGFQCFIPLELTSNCRKTCSVTVKSM